MPGVLALAFTTAEVVTVALIFVLAWFIKEVPLRGRTAPGDAEAPAPELVA